MKAAKLTYGMVHNYLFYPEYMLLRQLLDEGAVGELRHVGLHFMGVPDKPGHADYRPLWRHDRAEAGGGILMDMIHVIYLAEHFLGGEIRAVNAIVDNLDDAQGEVEDLALIQLHFDRGYATINLGWGQGPGGVEVTGTGGRILVFYQDYVTGPFNELEQFVVLGAGGRREYQPRHNHRMEDTFVAIHEDFLGALKERREPIAPASAGVRGLMAALAIYASALTGKVVELPLGEEHPLYELGLEGLRALDAWPGSPVVARRLFGLGAEKGVAA
jgi:predicted dehydrogenase